MAKKKTVWKFVLEIGVYTDIEMPQGDVLAAKMQHGKVCVWFLVLPDSDQAKRRFLVALTGQEIEGSRGGLEFIDTVMSDDGNFVFHVFEVT